MEVVVNVMNAKTLRMDVHVRIAKNAGGIMARKSALMQIGRCY